MHKAIFIWLVLPSLLLVGCVSQTFNQQPGEASTEIAVTATPTIIISATPTPTKIDLPTATARTVTATVTPSVTPTIFPALATEGPYFIVNLFTFSDEENYAIYNADGRGRRIITLPPNGSIPSLTDAISPDGQWLAFYIDNLFAETNAGIEFYIMHWQTDTVHHIANIVSEDYEQKLANNAEMLPTMQPEMFAPDIDWTMPLLWSFNGGTMVSAWSPDSQSLAFTGQIDGASLDVYVYDLHTSSVRRITDDILNVDNIIWSPDGALILYENALPGQNYQGSSLYSVEASLEEAKTPVLLQSGWWWIGQDWITPEHYLLTGVGDGGPRHDLRAVDTEASAIQLLWADVYEDSAIDEENQMVAVSSAASAYSFADDKPHAEDGLYLISMNGSTQKISDEIYWFLTYRGIDGSYLIGHDGKQIVSIARNGLATLLYEAHIENVTFDVSPDGAWVAIYHENGLDLYNQANENVLTLPIAEIAKVFWRPDSQGLFFTTGYELYYLATNEMVPILVDRCASEECSFSSYKSGWIP